MVKSIHDRVATVMQKNLTRVVAQRICAIQSIVVLFETRLVGKNFQRITPKDLCEKHFRGLRVA
jgi:hypothetical protein